MSIAVGARVVVRNLTSARAAAYNGRIGTVQSWDAAKARATVALDATQEVSEEFELGAIIEACELPLRAANMQPVSRAAEAAEMSRLIAARPAAVEPGDASQTAESESLAPTENAVAKSDGNSSDRNPGETTEKAMFAAMFSRPGALSAAEPDVAWNGGALPRVFFDHVCEGGDLRRCAIESPLDQYGGPCLPRTRSLP